MQPMRPDQHKLVALLPMKAHSARVTGKNFRLLGSRPLYRWILDELLSIDAVDEIIVNTDARDRLASSGLTETSRICVRDRKPELCGDMVSMNKVLADDIENVSAETYLMTHATNPFLRAGTIRRALGVYEEKLEDSVADSLFTVTKFQTRFYREDGSAVNHNPMELVRTQDLEPWFEENSCLYIFSARSFRSMGARIGRKPVMFETPRLESLDIDTEEDWAHAALLVQAGYPFEEVA